MEQTEQAAQRQPQKTQKSDIKRCFLLKGNRKHFVFNCNYLVY